jgi:hypothetical protein
MIKQVSYSIRWCLVDSLILTQLCLVAEEDTWNNLIKTLEDGISAVRRGQSLIMTFTTPKLTVLGA